MAEPRPPARRRRAPASPERAGHAPTVMRLVLGSRLRALRERAGLGCEEAAEVLDVNQATVRRMEKAETGLKLPYLEKLLAAYHVPGPEAQHFLALARDANRHGWWHAYRDVLPDWLAASASLEAAADRIRSYDPHTLPALLQTPEYAAALLRAQLPTAPPRGIARRAEFRGRRREVLLREAAPPVLWALVEEAALRRAVGGPEVMRAQLDRLLDDLQRPNVVLQVLPFRAGAHAAQFGPFTIYRLPLPEIPDVVHAEHVGGAAYLEEPAAVAGFRAAADRAAVLAAPAQETPGILRAIRAELG